VDGTDIEQVRIVAVSKLKPATDILALHQEGEGTKGHVHFGENYAQELTEKAELLPTSIQWHFIGGLQSSMSLIITFSPLASPPPSLFNIDHVLRSSR